MVLRRVGSEGFDPVHPATSLARQDASAARRKSRHCTPEVPAMTLIHRADPCDEFLALRRTRPSQIQMSAAAIDSQPEPERVGAGDRR